MSRSTEFATGHQNAGHEQLDLLVENFKERNIGGSRYGRLTDHVDIVPDRHGEITYLSDTQTGGSYASTKAYQQEGESGDFKERGYLDQVTNSDFDDPHGYEISMVETSSSHRRRGIASAMFNFARQFRDVRHSMRRLPEGVAWSLHVGGSDTAGRDVRAYHFYDHSEAEFEDFEQDKYESDKF